MTTPTDHTLPLSNRLAQYKWCPIDSRARVYVVLRNNTAIARANRTGFGWRVIFKGRQLQTTFTSMLIVEDELEQYFNHT